MTATPRRQLLKLAGASLVATATSNAFSAENQYDSKKPTGWENKYEAPPDYCGSGQVYPFYGEHQSGILTPQQRFVYFLAADLNTSDIAIVREIFKTWTEYSVRLMKGQLVRPFSENKFVPPTDTAENYDLSTYGLTLTFGVGPSFMKKLGLEDKAPAEFKPIPSLPRDQLRPDISDGDLCIQACADDPQVAFHAVRQLVRSARQHLHLRWSKMGFLGMDGKNTPRNLFGFRDGTDNHRALDKPKEEIWVTHPGWMHNGTYLVVRNIFMHLDTWDRTSYSEQENTFGRYRVNAAGFEQKGEFDKIDTEKMPDTAHVRLAHETGKLLYRRPYSYSDGITPRTGQYDSGLLFITFQKDPEQFITIQRAFGNEDKLNEYITHIGSAIFACFGGVEKEGDYLGQALLG